MKFNHVDAAMKPATTPPVGVQFKNLPLFARCAIERLDCDESLRTNIMLDELLNGYAKAMGTSCDSITRDCAHRLCVSRYYGAFSILG
jgi:hypothetical protein